jgi:hypothetical protein
MISLYSDTTDFVIKDKETEKKYKFVLTNSLKTARDSPFLAGWSVYVTKSCEPTPDQFEPIISTLIVNISLLLHQSHIVA